jgi:hypothetical protein
MHQDVCFASGDVEVVVVAAGNGDAPHPPDGVRRRAPADDRDAGVVTRDAEVVAAPERSGLDPLVLGKVEEQVPAGGVNDRGATAGPDRQVVQVGVVMNQDGGDRLGLGFAGLGIGGKDLNAGFELADGDDGTGGEQDLGGCREAQTTGCCRVFGDRSAFSCGQREECPLEYSIKA